MLQHNEHAAERIRFVQLQIQTQSHCNGRCIICPYDSVRTRLPQGTMPWPLFTRIIRDLTGYPSLNFIGLMLQNEPLLDRELERKIEYLKNEKPTIELGIATNGSLLTARRLDSLTRAGLDHLTFSLNALTRKTFEQIQPALDFDSVISNLRRAIERAAKTPRLKVKMMITRENFHEFAAPEKFTTLFEEMREHKITYHIKPISNRAGSLEAYRELLIQENQQHSRHRIICNDLFETVNVIFNGDVISCCADWRRLSVLGNLGRKDFREIWHGGKARSMRDGLLRGRYESMVPCRDCNQAWNIMAQRKRQSGG